MGKNWKDICARVQQGATIRKTDKDVTEVVSNWHELGRFMALELTSTVGRPVDVVLPKNQLSDADKRLSDGAKQLATEHCLTATFGVPDAAADIHFVADLLRRTLNVSMKLRAPRNRKLATASINFFTRQLKGRSEGDNVIVRADWPGRIPDTDALLAKVVADPKVLLSGAPSILPKFLEFIRVEDLAGKFQGSRTFVEFSVAALNDFYADVGQHLEAWVPSPPKVKKKVSEEVDDHEEQRLSAKENADTQSDQTNTGLEENSDKPISEAKDDNGLLKIPTFLIRRLNR